MVSSSDEFLLKPTREETKSSRDEFLLEPPRGKKEEELKQMKGARWLPLDLNPWASASRS